MWFNPCLTVYSSCSGYSRLCKCPRDLKDLKACIKIVGKEIQFKCFGCRFFKLCHSKLWTGVITKLWNPLSRLLDSGTPDFKMNMIGLWKPFLCSVLGLCLVCHNILSRTFLSMSQCPVFHMDAYTTDLPCPNRCFCCRKQKLRSLMKISGVCCEFFCFGLLGVFLIQRHKTIRLQKGLATPFDKMEKL